MSSEPSELRNRSTSAIQADGADKEDFSRRAKFNYGTFQDITPRDSTLRRSRRCLLDLNCRVAARELHRNPHWSGFRKKARQVGNCADLLGFPLCCS